MFNMILLFIGSTEIIVIGGIALLLFGGKKLPELMRSMGKGVKEFKTGMTEGTEAFHEEVDKSVEASLNIESPESTESKHE